MLEPDYYSEFHCKMGACRHTCCRGWPISVSLQDYHRLLGYECPESLRRKLDVSLHPCEHPTEERYAQLSPGFDGNCRMFLPDGRCELHAELGADALPEICRLYPRRIRTEGAGECSCANSCEAVLEQFLHREAPLTFIGEGNGTDWERRLALLHCLQDRGISLPERIRRLGHLLGEEGTESVPDVGHRERGLRLAMDLLQEVTRRSQSVAPYGTEVLRCFQGDLLAQHREATENFVRQLPQWEQVFEHILVNHLFFSGFQKGYRCLCALYALLRLGCVGWMKTHSGETEFIDVCAAIFRFVAHSNFETFAECFLENASDADLDALLCV